MASNGWPIIPLGDVTVNLDSIRVPVKEAERKPGPYPYYGASGIVDHVDGYLFEGEHLLIAEDGENLRTRQTPIAFMATGKFWVNNHAHIVKGNDRALTRFLCYALADTDISGYLSGSTMPKLTQGNMNRIPVLTPPLSVQERIVEILGSLDDKIDLNRRMNETLEAMARRLFKSWFVDFDPVHAKAALRREQPKLSNGDLSRRALPNMAPEIAELFPDSFENSTLGLIPKGWKVQTLDAGLSVLETGSRPKGGVKHIESGVPSVGAESIVGIGRFDFGKTKYVPEEFFNAMNRGHIEDRDVLLYKDGGRPGEYEPHVSMFGGGFPFARFCINEHVYRLRTNDLLTQEFLYFWLTSEGPMEEMRVKGTGVAIPGLNSTAVKSLATLLPEQRVVAAFTHAIGPKVSAIFTNCSKSKVLAGLRDKLLPRLLTGDVPLLQTTKD